MLVSMPAGWCDLKAPPVLFGGRAGLFCVGAAGGHGGNMFSQQLRCQHTGEDRAAILIELC